MEKIVKLIQEDNGVLRKMIFLSDVCRNWCKYLIFASIEWLKKENVLVDHKWYQSIRIDRPKQYNMPWK